jgi:hypothetical protein
METKDYIYTIGILLTFLVSICNLIHTWRISKKTLFINCVTAERVNWIKNVRVNIATFCGLTHHFHWSQIDNRQKENILKQIDRLRMLIRLQLNPYKEHHKKIIDLVTNKIPDLAGKTGGTVPIDEKAPIDKALDELVSASQLVVEEEWDRIKKEVRKGDIVEL